MGPRFDISRRLKELPPYLFVEMDRAKKEAVEKGRDVIDLGVGDPDQPTPRFIIDAFHRATLDAKTHAYPSNKGLPELRIAIAKWYKLRFGVELNPDNEILPLIGSKEGIAHMPLAFINSHDAVLVPEPCYPPYKSGVIFAGGEVAIMPLLEKNNFLPDLGAVKSSLLSRTKLMFLNYPNNPTAATAEPKFFSEVVRFAEKNNIIVCHDAAYSEVSFDGYKPTSFLAAEGAREVGIEFHSLSKTFNMTGWRIGFACGNAHLIEGLAKIKSNIDSGIFNAVQMAGVEALKKARVISEKNSRLYQKRRDVLVSGLRKLGWNVPKPKASFYVWAPVLKRYTSVTMARELLERADLVVTPGNGFGQNGEGYVRMSLTVDESRLAEAVRRISKVIN